MACSKYWLSFNPSQNKIKYSSLTSNLTDIITLDKAVVEMIILKDFHLKDIITCLL